MMILIKPQVGDPKVGGSAENTIRVISWCLNMELMRGKLYR